MPLPLLKCLWGAAWGWRPLNFCARVGRSQGSRLARVDNRELISSIAWQNQMVGMMQVMAKMLRGKNECEL